MPEAVIASTARTPIGRAFKGSLVDTDPFTLAKHAVGATIERSGLDPALIDDMVLGESLYGGGDIARYVAVDAGLEHIPGAALNRHCASGLSAVVTGAASIRAGMDRRHRLRHPPPPRRPGRSGAHPARRTRST
ncbi:MAG: hypothetical protein R2695_11205 [Acidimicrobiales bacterium]